MEMTSLRSIIKAAICIVGFLFVFGGVIVEDRPNPLFINGKSFGNAVRINGVLAISVEDFAKAISGTPNLQQAGLKVQGNTLKLVPAVQSAASPRDPASGLPTGKRMHKPFVITKELDKATPLLYQHGKAYVAVADIAKAFGGVFAPPQNLTPGAPINLNFPPSPNAVLVGDVNG